MKQFIFKTVTPFEKWRVATLETKEPGTIKWIEEEVGPEDVVYDIGANMGIYSVMAGARGATVYAFEPHQPTAEHLIENIQVNGLERLVTVFTTALHSEEGYLPFNSYSKEAGSSGSQLGHAVDEFGRAFVPAKTETVYATTIDRLVAAGTIQPATCIKLDVDGNEHFVLQGMARLLKEHPPRLIQVEVHPSDDEKVVEFMDGFDYEVSKRHWTQMGQEAIDKGYNPAKVAHNVIFRPCGKLAA